MKDMNVWGVAVGVAVWAWTMFTMFDGNDAGIFYFLILGAGMLVPAYFAALLSSVFIGKKPQN